MWPWFSTHTIVRNIVIRSSDNPYKEIIAYHVVDHRSIYLVCKKRLVADRCRRSRDAIWRVGCGFTLTCDGHVKNNDLMMIRFLLGIWQNDEWRRKEGEKTTKQKELLVPWKWLLCFLFGRFPSPHLHTFARTPQEKACCCLFQIGGCWWCM